MNIVFFIIYILCLSLWGFSFLPQLGWKRSLMIALSRGLWLLPLILALFPIKEAKDLPRAMMKTPIHVLLDDSDSMKEGLTSSPFAQSKKLLESMRNLCYNSACELKETLLSQENSLTKISYTPLRQGLSTWFSRIGHDPWVLISDGGDSTPNLAWPKEWQNLGRDADKKTLGLLVSVPDTTSERLWIENVVAAPVSFEGSQPQIEILLKRKRKSLQAETVQVQVRESEQILLSENIYFPEGQNNSVNFITLPSLSRGPHELEVKVLAPPGEKRLWDKSSHVSVEVISNTLGVLHLLGSPHWDGRFLRRYLKSEPKYDMISFFILRDPWDMQFVDERELSLIPFPVSRLFNEELKKFRTVVLQNFNLIQFLAPEYQRNLVEFVRNGGSLLFLGGQRSLQTQDLRNSPLKEIIPFDFKQEMNSSDAWDLTQNTMDMNGPWYDKNLGFTISLSDPSPEKLALADVYEEWALLSEQMQEATNLKGLHHMENVRFKSDYTPLLDALTSDGKKIPLAVASYPGKGRAIWIFSDQLWRLAMSPQNDISRSVYNRMMESSFLWLMRHDFRRPLTASHFQMQSWGPDVPMDWSVEIEGPAVRYFEPGKSWSMLLCGQVMDLYKAKLTRFGPTHAMLSGKVQGKGSSCALEFRGQHMAFGSVFETRVTNIPDMIKDANVGVSEIKMQKLSELTGAQILSLGEFDKTLSAIETWLGEKTGQQGVLLPPRFRTVVNHYWIFESFWFFLFLFFLPLEVLVRRWDKLTR